MNRGSLFLSGERGSMIGYKYNFVEEACPNKDCFSFSCTWLFCFCFAGRGEHPLVQALQRRVQAHHCAASRAQRGSHGMR